MFSNVIQWISGMMLFMSTATARSGRSDEDVRRDVELRCAEKNLPFFKVDDKHYCCGCPAGQYVYSDCKINHQNTTICMDCPNNSTLQTYTSVANTQKRCNITKPPEYCEDFMYTHYVPVSGNSKKPTRCECVPGTYATDPVKYGCLKYTPCMPMFYVTKVGDSSHPYECSRCPVGKCTYSYSFADKCLPCNGSNVSIPTTPKDPTPTKMVPLSTTKTRTASVNSLPNWVIPTIVICSFAFLVLGFIIGVLLLKPLKRWFNGRNTRNSPNSQVTDEERRPLRSPEAPRSDEDDHPSVSSGCGTSIGDPHEGSSATIGSQRSPTPQRRDVTEEHEQNANHNNRSEDIHQTAECGIEQPQGQPGIVDILPDKAIIENEDQVAQTGGQVTGAPSGVVEAGVHDPEDEPLKGCIRTLNPVDYEQKFLAQGFRKKYEPNVEPNCLFEAVAKGKDHCLSDDNVVEHARGMRERVVHYIEQHKELFRSSISLLSYTVENYLDRLRDPAQPCDEIVARVIAFTEKVNIQLVHVDRIGDKFCGCSDEDPRNVIHIGHVEKNYFLLLEQTWERRDGDPEASSNRLPISDSRVEVRGQSVSYHMVSTDGQQPSTPPSEVSPTVENRSRQRECNIPNYTKPPEQLRIKKDWYLFDSSDQELMMKNHLSKQPGLDLSGHLDDVELAKAMLLGSPELLHDVTPLVKKNNSTVNSFVRLPKLVEKPEVLLSDATESHGHDQLEKRYYLINKVINERGRTLSTRLILECSVNNRILHRHFSDCFTKFLDVKYSEPSENGLPE